MDLCSHHHEEICFSSKYCPLCEAIVDHKSKVADLESEIESLEKQIQEIEVKP